MADDAKPQRGRLQRIIEGVQKNEFGGLKALVPSGWKAAIKARMLKGKHGVIEIDDEASLDYPLGDSYWAHHANNIRGYEPELWFVADKFINKGTVFVDCGANIGLWSTYAASKIKNPDQVIAVEPGESVLKVLQHNHARNNQNFTLMDRAVWSNSDETLQFAVSERHASSGLVQEGDEPLRDVQSMISVRTVSIDDIVNTAFDKAPNARNVIVKLDVEGAERPALEGAARTMAEKNAMIVYEDHGKEPESKTTAHFLDHGLNVYYIAAPDDVRQVHSAEQLAPVKTDPTKGYNFVACRPGSEFDMEFQQLCRHSEHGFGGNVLDSKEPITHGLGSGSDETIAPGFSSGSVSGSGETISVTDATPTRSDRTRRFPQ